MWNNLPKSQREEYKRMILAFASLTEMFAQKAETETASPDESDGTKKLLNPIINSKYQETVFQRVFNASAEDIGNTSYDASICHTNTDGCKTKYVIGIKTFGYTSGFQKVAQFKAYHDDWSDIINQIKANSKKDDGTARTKGEIDILNNRLYMELAKNIALLRNIRIDSSESNLHGFSVSDEKDKDDIQSVYHVLMPSVSEDKPYIHVGETSYDKIQIDDIHIEGCTSAKNPTNFKFNDGRHTYRFTSADSQLHMDFNNKDIVQESWEVKYADDAYEIFSGLADHIYGDKEVISESYSWFITNNKGEVERFSGFNSFFGVGSKLSTQSRMSTIEKLHAKYLNTVDIDLLSEIIESLKEFLIVKAGSLSEKLNKVEIRNNILKRLNFIGNEDLKKDITKLLYRPQTEMYIPIPNAARFHLEHPDFFGPGIGLLEKSNGKWKLPLPKEQCRFNLIFEPSGDKLESFITQDTGKAIESYGSQAYLGEWILRGVFQLKEYEPLTSKKLNEVGINGIRLYKLQDSNDIHLQFIWIDRDNLPDDFVK